MATPLIGFTTPSQDKVDGATEYSALVPGDVKGVRYLVVTPSQTPDGAGTYHGLGVNASTPSLEIRGVDPYIVDMQTLESGDGEIKKVFLTAGKDATTFRIEGHR